MTQCDTILPHDVEDLPGEDAVLLVLLLLGGLAGDVEVALQLGDLVLLEGLGELLHLDGKVWNEHKIEFEIAFDFLV